MRLLKGIAKLTVALVAGVAFVFVGANGIVMLSTQGDLLTVDQAAEWQGDHILVLGASVLPDGSPSGMLRDRLDVAAELFFAGAAPRVLVSGDNRYSSYNEVAAMKGYLEALGVPGDCIESDPAGFNTYDSMWRAAKLYDVKRVVVVTQGYHEYRAIFNAKGVGMQACGVSSDLHKYAHQGFYDLRESLARVKDLGQVVLGMPAHVQTEQLPTDIAEAGGDPIDFEETID